jgi:outer membrane receptor protein involved in Fe transport
LTFRAAAYRGWRLPTLNELYRPFRVGPDATAANATLKPEHLEGIEAGARIDAARWLHLGATAFFNRLEDGIANITLGQGPGIFPGVGFVAGTFSQRGNVDAITSRGVELDGSVILGQFRLEAGLSIAHARVHASGAAGALDGRRPAQTPARLATAQISWQGASGAHAMVQMRYTANQFEDDLNTQLIPNALTFDAAASVPIANGISLMGRIENFTNERLIAGISGDDILERATPRTIWVGISWHG